LRKGDNLIKTRKPKREKKFGLAVECDGNIEKALRQLKRKVENAKLLQEVKERQEYVKPSVKRKIAKNSARKRWLKKLSSQKLQKKMY
jgi:small subunit ribosomal protein S21